MFLHVVQVMLLLIINTKVSRSLEWRVFDGQDLRYDVHSYLVKLQFFRYNNFRIGMCSGCIISCSWIITSAHCIQPKLRTIRVLHKTKYNTRVIGQVKNRDIHKHPEFKLDVDTMQNREKDVALLQLKEEIKINSYIRPIELSLIRPKIGDAGIIAGFGESEVNLKAPREGVVVINKCPDIYRYKTRNICTEGSVRAGSGDSGGPLFYKGKLAGLISGGCLNVKSNNMCLTVYASVESNLEWIVEVIGRYY